MQLVMRRFRFSAQEGMWYNFRINARMVVSYNEEDIITKYKLRGVSITEGNRWRDARKAMLMVIPIAVFVWYVVALHPTSRWWSISEQMVIVGVIFAICSYFIYHQIREEVRVNDLLTGRDFKARSFIGLL